MHVCVCVCISDLYSKAGVSPACPIVLLLTENHIVHESLLSCVTDYMSSGYICDMYSRDDLDTIATAVRAEAKLAGVPDSMHALVCLRI